MKVWNIYCYLPQ